MDHITDWLVRPRAHQPLMRRHDRTASSTSSPILERLCNPLLRPLRRVIPPIGGLDLSPIFVLIGLQALQILLR